MKKRPKKPRKLAEKNKVLKRKKKEKEKKEQEKIEEEQLQDMLNTLNKEFRVIDNKKKESQRQH